MGEDQGAVGTRAVGEGGVPRETTVGDAPAAGTAPRTPESSAELRDDIERTRRELGDTVAALAEKTDVKARAREKVAEVRHTVTEKKSELMGRARESSPDGASSAADQVRAKAQQNPIPTAALRAIVGGFVIARITRRG